ncbi:MAG TPA: hypothetical protein PLV92_26290 [Pirellulaceae bacterium]|nr:hypothetical protein [Pirellulaceae bacterium]
MVAVFTRRLTDDLTGLVKQLDETVTKNQDKQMKGLVVYLSDDPDTGEEKLKEIAKKLGISKNTPLTVFQTSEGPDNYKIAKDADVTVLMWSKLKVKANHAFGKAPLDDAAVKKVLADSAKLLE